MDKIFLEIQKALVPPAQEFSNSQKNESLRLMHMLLNGRPKKDRVLFKIFLILIQASSWVFMFKSFRALNFSERQNLLGRFFDSPIPVFRKGFWGLNSICKLGVYGQTSIYTKINYKLRSQKNGNS